MENNFSNIGYKPLKNEIDFSIGNQLSIQSANNTSTLQPLPPNQVHHVDRSLFTPLKNAVSLIAPVSLFNYLTELPDISIFTNLLPKNNAPSYESIKSGDGKVSMSLGQVGPSVRNLQKSLNKLGFNVKETGVFDVYTQTALKKFQAANKVEQTGMLGKTTLDVLDKVEQTKTNRGLVSVSKFMNPDNSASYHYCQYSGLASQNGDCGPSAALMVLRANGINTNVRQVRQAAGVTRPRSGAWAISEGEIAQSVKRLSGGKIKEVDRKTFNPLNHGKFISYLKSELDKGRMPILLTGNNGMGRHYTVVVGVKPDGSILVADSSISSRQNGGISTYSPNNMRRRMATALLSGGTHVMSFART